jgi:hypothetical protein
LFAFGCAASQADGDGGASGEGDNSVAAKIGDQVITNAELDAEVRKTNSKAYQAYYDARKRALGQMITQRVVNAEIAKRGITGGLAPVSDAEVEAFFAKNPSQMGDRTLEQMTAQIQQHLTNQRISKVMSDFVTDLKKKAGVKVYLDPPRSDVKIAANDPKKGPEGAPITLVEFSDFQ